MHDEQKSSFGTFRPKYRAEMKTMAEMPRTSVGLTSSFVAILVLMTIATIDAIIMITVSR